MLGFKKIKACSPNYLLVWGNEMQDYVDELLEEARLEYLLEADEEQDFDIDDFSF